MMTLDQYYRDELGQPLSPGDVVWTWCSLHFDRTDHLWTGKRLICLECYPDLKPTTEEAE